MCIQIHNIIMCIVRVYSSPEIITLASEGCSRALVEADCLPVLLELIVQTNRSQAALVVVAGIIRILSNICKVRFEHLLCCSIIQCQAL